MNVLTRQGSFVWLDEWSSCSTALEPLRVVRRSASGLPAVSRWTGGSDDGDAVPKGDRETAARKCVPSTLCWSDLLGVPAWYLWRARCSNSWEQGTEIVQGCVFSAEDDLRLPGTGLLNTAGYNCHHYRWWKIMFFMAMVKNNVEQWVEQWCVYPFFFPRERA